MRTVARVIMLGLVAAATSSIPVPASAETEASPLLVPVTVDAHVKVAKKKANYGAKANLVVDGRRANRSIALMRVTIPADATAGSFQLLLRPTTSLSRGVRVYRAGNNWREPDVTWKKRPARGQTLIGTSDALVAGVDRGHRPGRLQRHPGEEAEPAHQDIRTVQARAGIHRG